MNRLMSLVFGLALLVFTPLCCSATLIGDTIYVDRIIPSGPFSPYSFSRDTLGLPGPITVIVAAGDGDRIALSGGNNLYADVDDSSIRLDLGPGNGTGGPTDIHLIEFTDLDWIGSAGFITGVTFDTDLSGMSASRISFTADSVSVDISQLSYSGGQFLEIYLQTSHVPEPSTIAIYSTFSLMGLALRYRNGGWNNLAIDRGE